MHALGQVVASIPKLQYLPPVPAGHQHLLPSDIRVIHSEEAAADFHPRYQARCKTYRYLVYQAREGYTFYRRYAHQYTRSLDLLLLQEATRCIIGKHDFRGFMARGSNVQETVRTVFQFTTEHSFPWLKFEITGDGFLSYG